MKNWIMNLFFGNVLKRVEEYVDKGKKDTLDAIEKLWPEKMAKVDEKLRVQNEEVIQELRKETEGMKEWVEKRLEGTVDLVKAILDQADAKIKIADANIEIANKIHSKPAELKLTVNFKGQK